MSETEHKHQNIPSVYIACLSSYNNGILHGSWINLKENSSVDELEEAINEIMALSPIAGAEEWAIHDYTGFYGYPLRESASLQTIVELSQNILKHGEPYALLCKYQGRIVEIIDFEDAYVGSYESEESFGEEQMELLEVKVIPESYTNYFDVEEFARGLLISDYHHENGTDGSLYVFRYL